MSRIISIHEYVLKPGVAAVDFERAVRIAKERQLFALPGLINYHFIKGIKGARRGQYTAVWIYESQAAWEALWGSPEQPRPKQAYPTTWLIWEDELLAPLLTVDPDLITFTTYAGLTIGEAQ